MEEFFREGTIPQEHLIVALHEAIREDRIFPVLYTSGLRNVGTDHLLDFLKVYAPSPVERVPVAARGTAVIPGIRRENQNHDGAPADLAPDAEMVLRKVDDHEPLSLYVFKTMSDPFAGRICFFKVFSGVARTDSAITNYTHHSVERLAHLTVMQGRTATPITELHAGDIGAVAKLRETYTGDTLGDAGSEIYFDPVTMPEPAVTYAIEPKTRADEEKLAPAVHKLMEEDPMVRFYRDDATHEFLLAGSGQPHIESIVHKLRRRYHTEVTLKAPKVPYRETIRGRADARAGARSRAAATGSSVTAGFASNPSHWAQDLSLPTRSSAGQFRVLSSPRSRRAFRKQQQAHGWLAGYPIVDFRAVLYDGSYHDVDSNERLSFRLAGRRAFRNCMEQAKPVLLEPLMRVEIEAPETFTGAIMGDLTGRRGRVQGMGSSRGTTIIRAEVPMAEMLSYGATLTSMTQGLGSFHMEMTRYDVVPAVAAEKVIAAAHKHAQVDEDT